MIDNTVTDKNDAQTELRRFLLEGLPNIGILAEAPRYGLVDLIIPDEMATALDGRTFLRLALSTDAAASDRDTEYLSYGSPLLDRLLALVRAGTANARWYVHGLQHPPKDLRVEVTRQISLPNAWVSPKPGREDMASHYAAIFWFRAAMLSHEKRERLVSVAIDLHSHRPLSPQTLQLARLDAEGDVTMSVAPFWAPPGSEPVTDLEIALDQAQKQAAHLAEQDLAADLAAAAERSSRRLEAARSRLEGFYADMAHSLELRLRRADEDKKEGLQVKLAAVAAEREQKLHEADEQYRLRLVLHLAGGAIIARPMPTTSVVIENRYTSAMLPVAWDTLGKSLDIPVCQICQTPTSVLHLCANGHLVCPADIIRCSACKREYCRNCGTGACVVDHAPLCSHHPACPTCGKTVCPEHLGLCHKPSPAPEVVAEKQKREEQIQSKASPRVSSKVTKAQAKAARPIPTAPTRWEKMRRMIHPGFARLREQQRLFYQQPGKGNPLVEPIRRAQTAFELERLMDGLPDDAWEVWAEQAAKFSFETQDLIWSLVESTHPSNQTIGAMTISYLVSEDLPLFLSGIGRMPPELQATIAVGLGCSATARSVPAVGDALWRLASKLYRDIGQSNADACWAAILALQDLDDSRRDDALLMALTRVGVAHIPHLLLVAAARDAARVTQALITFATAQAGTDLELQVVQALAMALEAQGEIVRAGLSATPAGQALLRTASRPEFGASYGLRSLWMSLIPGSWQPSGS